MIFGVVLLAVVLPLWPQVSLPALSPHDEPLSFIGMKLDDMYRRFGVPQQVYAARGDESWQDDVVFSYPDGDFYIYRDRVWQIRLTSLYGMRVGDARAVALLVLGEQARDGGDYLVYSLPGTAWPISLRVNCAADKISAIFVYRPDY